MDKDLNRLSAEIIMGWVIMTHKEAGFESAYPRKAWFKPIGECDDGSIAWEFVCWKDTLNEVWGPLHDLNQCFKVVEKMEDSGWWFYLQTFELWPKLKRASFSMLSIHLEYKVVKTTANEAILTAALKAKGVEVE